MREWQERKREAEERRQELERQRQSPGLSATATEAESLPAENAHSHVTHLDPTPFWQHRERKSLASRLPEAKYYFNPPSRYVFPGAEVYSEEEESDGESDSSDEDCTDDGNDGENVQEMTQRGDEPAEQEVEQNQNECTTGREGEDEGRGSDAGQQSIDDS